MRGPKISVLLCTARPDQGYVEHPEWHTIGKVVEDLSNQTFKDFELIVVDGLNRRQRWDTSIFDPDVEKQHFRTQVVPPRPSFWVWNKKVAISAYRNTGLMLARGELVVNLDDCCELPPDYLETFWHVYKRYGICLAMTWPDQGDQRVPGPVQHENIVHGFGSYPRDLAIRLGGYDESYDGGQGLEDINWSMRLFRSSLSMGLQHIPGFRIHAQSAHDPEVIDSKDPIVKCCNVAHYLAQDRIKRGLVVANAHWTRPQLEALCSTPCFLLGPGGVCQAPWAGGRACAYLSRGWPQEKRHPLWKRFLDDKGNWPILSFQTERQEAK